MHNAIVQANRMAILLFVAEYRDRIDCGPLIELVADERADGLAERTSEAMREMERLAGLL